MLMHVAKGLGELKEDIVFVGGSVAELYADDPATSDVRPTLDIDCVVELSTRKAYYEMEERLRKKKFKNDTTSGAPICRWTYDGIIVDIMPTDTNILGFGNQWYKAGILHKTVKSLPDNTSIYVFPVEYYLATKFEALKSRGGSDLRLSHDFEDIIFIMDNMTAIIDIIRNKTDSFLISYLTTQCSNLLLDKNIEEAISCALPLNSEEERATDIIWILKQIKAISDYY